MKYAYEDEIDTVAAEEVVKWYYKQPQHVRREIGRRVCRNMGQWIAKLHTIVSRRKRMCNNGR